MRLQRPFLGLSLITLTSIAAADCPQLVSNGGFDAGSGAGWTVSYSGTLYTNEVAEDSYNPGNYFYVVEHEPSASPNVFDAELSQTVTLTEGAEYRLTFWGRVDDALYGNGSGTSPGHVKVGGLTTPYPSYGLDESFVWESNLGAGEGYSYTFTANASGDAGLAIFFGAEDATYTIDSISLEETSSSSCPGGGTGGSTGGTGGTGGTGNTGGIGGRIFNNQLGYVPGGEKVATLESGASIGQAWELRNDSGTVVASGTTTVDGPDDASGDSVHLIDFSDYDTAGSGYRIWVGNAAGPAFSIGQDVYGALRRDALRFFYYQRSGEAITQPYAEGTQYARAAGHDYATTCAGCSYSLDTRSGWYDAGDYGKYVVNGGISLWTLLNLYERTQHLGTSLTSLGDGMNNIPESANGQSDLLDETRKEIDFMLSMQVPAGRPNAGMAHHKVHSTTWDARPVTPEDAKLHVLHPVSTAATLNLAATAAQCARVFSSLDAPLASRCLGAAETAYSAAKSHPDVLQGTVPSNSGGGAYDDAKVSDEFYWAAAELFITTGETSYLQDLLSSPHHAQLPAAGDALAWPTTAALGMISLAVVPSELAPGEVEALRYALVQRAEADAARAASGYGTAVSGYFWGSNSSVLNAGLVSALAYDLTGTAAFRATALSALDYVLGRNPLGQSYVTQYGSQPFENPHHRFWAGTLGFPAAPPGVLAGGPNQNSGDWAPGTTTSVSTSCFPSKCWADIEDDYSMTEVTVNWNAPLAWLASWASEQENDPQTTFPGVDEAYPTDGGDGTGGGEATGGSSNGSDATGGASSGGDGDGDRDGDRDGETDEGSSGDGNGDADEGSSGDGDGGATSAGNASSDSGGCSYSSDSGHEPRNWWIWALVVGGLHWARRRRSRAAL